LKIGLKHLRVIELMKIESRIARLEKMKPREPVLEFNDMFDEEKIKAHRAKYGIDPRVKTFEQMYEN
jgi:hypothetical protein